MFFYLRRQIRLEEKKLINSCFKIKPQQNNAGSDNVSEYEIMVFEFAQAKFL